MKYIFTIYLSLYVVIAMAQQSQEVKEVRYCGYAISVPEGCMADSDYEVVCDDFAIQWMYLEPDMLSFMPKQYMDQLDERLKKFRKRNIQLVSFENKIDGYLVSYKDDREIKYKIIAFGTVNDQAVMLNLALPKEPINNEDLPALAKQFIRIQ